MGVSKKKLSRGIFRDASGIAIRISINGKPKEYRKDSSGKLYKDRDLNWLKQERTRRQAAATLIQEVEAVKAGTLEAGIAEYLKTLTGRAKSDAENLLNRWKPLHDKQRREITALELQQHAATWTCAASTYNHRRQALISLYRTLDGPDAPNPARGLPKRRETAGAPKALPYSVIRTVFRKMPASQSRARLKVMAYTGLPQMQIQKLTPEDWQGDRLRVTPRRKGAGAAGRWIPLSKEAQQAMKEFTRWNCWGNFSRSSLYKAWSRYAPTGTNPYSLRHSWITELYRRSKGDVIALQQLALHSRIEQTQRYAAAALEGRMKALVLPRKFATKPRGNGPQTSRNVQPTKRRTERNS